MNQYELQKIVRNFEAYCRESDSAELAEFLSLQDISISTDVLTALLPVHIRHRQNRGQEIQFEDYRNLGDEAVRIATRLIAGSSEDLLTSPPSSTNPASRADDATLPPEGRWSESNKVTKSPSPDFKRFLHYELIGEIARGGMGVVYRARDTRLNRIVALKMILAGGLASGEERLRFNIEAAAAAKLDHPGITPIYEIGEHEGQPYFAMKLIEGGSLADHLDEYVSDPKKAARLVADIAHAVHHAHQRGTLHRDLKPNNILLDKNGQPMITDFGLAKLTDSEYEVTRTGALMGTPGYMPPEQAASGKNVTTAADIYSLGAILFATLTGRPPFRGATAMETVMQMVQQDAPKPSSINSRAPIELELIALKSLERDPSKRYSSAAEMANDLEHWLAGEPVSVRAPSMALVAGQWVRRNIRMAAISLLIGFLAAAVSVPFCVWGFGQTNLPGAIYDVLPNTEHPLIAGMSFGLPKMGAVFEFMMMLLAATLVSSAGAIAVWCLKPKTMNESVGIGIMSGISVAVTLFLLFFGWLISGGAIQNYSDPDIKLIVAMANSDGAEKTMAEERILWRYPDLVSMDKSRWLQTLNQKILDDTTLMTGLGNLLAAIIALIFFLPVSLAAAYFFRMLDQQESWILRISKHLEFVCISVLFSFVLVWSLVTISLDFLPTGLMDGPRPTIFAMTASLTVLALAFYSIWTSKKPSVRFLLNVLAIGLFAYLASSVLTGATLNRDVTKLLDSNDFVGAARRFDLQTRQGGTWDGSGPPSIVLAARGNNWNLHDEFREKFIQRLRSMEANYSIYTLPYYLESVLMSPLPDDPNLERIKRMVQFVDKFATVEKYGTHRFLVLGLAEYRRGNLENALSQLDQIPVEAGSAYADTSRQPNTYLFDDQKSFALRAIIYHQQRKKADAIEEFFKLEYAMSYLRDEWLPSFKPTTEDGQQYYTSIRNAYHELELFQREAIAELSAGYAQEHWFDEYLADAMQQTKTAHDQSPQDIEILVDYVQTLLLQAHRHAKQDDFKSAKKLYYHAQKLAVKATELDANQETEGLVLRSINEFIRWPSLFSTPDDLNPALVDWLTTSDNQVTFAYNIAYKVAEKLSGDQNYQLAADWFSKSAEIARRLPTDYRNGYVVFGNQLEPNTIFFLHQDWGRDEQIAMAMVFEAQNLFMAGEEDRSLGVAEKLIADFPGVYRWEFDYYKILSWIVPEKAQTFLDGLDSPTPKEWKHNRELLKFSAFANTQPSEVSQVYRDRLESHLNSSTMPTEIKRRIRARKPLLFSGPFGRDSRGMVQSKTLGLQDYSAAEISETLKADFERNQSTSVHQTRILAPEWSNVTDVAKVFSSTTGNESLFAKGRIKSPKKQKVRLVIGNDDGIAVWLNNAAIAEMGFQSTFTDDAKVVEVELNEGVNDLLIRIDLTDGGVYFKFEMEDLDGWPANVTWMEPIVEKGK